MRLSPLVLPAVLAGFASTAVSAAPQVPFAELAQKLLDRAELADASPDTFDLRGFLSERYVHVRLGVFDAHLSLSAAQDPTYAKHYAGVLEVLVDVQGAWLDWLEPSLDAEHVKELRDDLRDVAKWAKGVRAGRVVSAAKEGPGDLLARLGASDKLIASAERLARAFGTGELLGQERPDSPEFLVLAPTRTDFMEHAALAGWIYPELQGTYWNPDVATWTQFYVDDVSVFALEYAQPGAGHWKLGTAMDAKESTGMKQQVAQLSAMALIDGVYGPRIPPSLAGALSVNLTIDLFGECETRADGDLRARRTEAFERFVPGGRSEGGWLPPVLADSRWRADQGSDRFVGVLRTSQRAGGKNAKRRSGSPRNFELHDDAETKRMVVAGPFLGGAAEGQTAVPANFKGDWTEFLRSYRSCFVHWLREASVGKSKDSHTAFSSFLVRAAAAEADADLEILIADAFGKVALSDEDLGPESLEGAFLAWLAKR